GACTRHGGHSPIVSRDWSKVLAAGDSQSPRVEVEAGAGDKDGAVFVKGMLLGTVKIDGLELGSTQGGALAFVAKFSPAGEAQWLEAVGPWWTIARPRLRELAIDRAGDVIVTRSGPLERDGTRSFELVKLASRSGAIVWSRKLPAGIGVNAI